jgi:hypothetical protein
MLAARRAEESISPVARARSISRRAMPGGISSRPIRSRMRSVVWPSALAMTTTWVS